VKKILIVDDDPDVVELTSEMMEIYGFKAVNDAFDGLQAVEKFAQYNPDVIILDLMMPQYDGFYTLDNLVKTNPETKIIIITGDQTQETAQKLKKYNLLGIFKKPADFEKVVQIINQ